MKDGVKAAFKEVKIRYADVYRQKLKMQQTLNGANVPVRI